MRLWMLACCLLVNRIGLGFQQDRIDDGVLASVSIFYSESI